MASKHVHSGGPGGGVNLGTIITPMLDMAFQLLAFFIMTYHPSALEGHIDGTLLTSARPAGSDAKHPGLLPDVIEPRFAENLLVTVKAVPRGQKEGNLWEGEPRWIELRTAQSPDVPSLVNGDRNVKADPSDRADDARSAWVRAYVKTLESDLQRELKKILNEPGAQGTDVKLDADPNLKHRYWMKFYDACKMPVVNKDGKLEITGFKNVHFVAPAQERKK